MSTKIFAASVLGIGLGLLLGNAYGFARGRDSARAGADAATVVATGMIDQAKDLIHVHKDEIRRNTTLNNEIRERISKHDAIIATAMRKAQGDGNILIYVLLAAVIFVASAMVFVFYLSRQRSENDVLLMYGVDPNQKRLLLRTVERQMLLDEAAARAVEADYAVTRK